MTCAKIRIFYLFATIFLKIPQHNAFFTTLLVIARQTSFNEVAAVARRLLVSTVAPPAQPFERVFSFIFLPFAGTKY